MTTLFVDVCLCALQQHLLAAHTAAEAMTSSNEQHNSPSSATTTSATQGENKQQLTGSLLETLLDILALAFTPDSVFHTKNHLKIWERSFYARNIAGGVQHAFTRDIDRYGWLLNLVNHVRQLLLA